MRMREKGLPDDGSVAGMGADHTHTPLVCGTVDADTEKPRPAADGPMSWLSTMDLPWRARPPMVTTPTGPRMARSAASAGSLRTNLPAASTDTSWSGWPGPAGATAGAAAAAGAGAADRHSQPDI
jgi:hypothetical protein